MYRILGNSEFLSCLCVLIKHKSSLLLTEFSVWFLTSRKEDSVLTYKFLQQSRRTGKTKVDKISLTLQLSPEYIFTAKQTFLSFRHGWTLVFKHSQISFHPRQCFASLTMAIEIGLKVVHISKKFLGMQLFTPSLHTQSTSCTKIQGQVIVMYKPRIYGLWTLF